MEIQRRDGSLTDSRAKREIYVLREARLNEHANYRREVLAGLRAFYYSQREIRAKSKRVFSILAALVHMYKRSARLENLSAPRIADPRKTLESLALCESRVLL